MSKLSEMLDWIKKGEGGTLSLSSYNVWLEIFAQRGNVKHVLQVLEEMKSQNIARDERTFNASMLAHIRGNSPNAFARVQQLFEEMKLSFMVPTPQTFRHLMEAAAAAGKSQSAVELFEEMQFKVSTKFSLLTSSSMT